MSAVTVRPLASRRDVNIFVKLPWSIYRGNPYWVPPLLMDRRKLIDRRKNPFYRHADAEFFLAEKNGSVVGRIGAIINHRHNAEHHENIGFFGFYECIEDNEVSRVLLETACAWLRQKGVTAVRGPASPSVNDEYGLLIDGFDKSPFVLMPYNPPYYATQLEAFGFSKIKDLYAYELHQDWVFRDQKFVRMADIVRKREGLVIRTLNMKDFDREIDTIKTLYNKAWQYNWGAVPMTDEEFAAMAKDLKPIVDPRLVLIAELHGEPIGFSLTLPDLNMALKYNRSGYLLTGLFHLWFHKKDIKKVRIIVLGIVPEKQKTGAGALLLYETGKRAIDIGLGWAEASWVLEDNVMMNRAAEFMSARKDKTYRIYQMPL